MTGGVGGVQGSLAEYAVVDASLLAHKPNNLSMREAAALPPDELISLLQQRLAALEKTNGRLQAELAALGTQLPRLFLIESEYYL